MFPLTINDFILTMAVGLFLMGLVTLATGIIIMVTRAGGKSVRVIADQTAQLAQKGIAEDISGLVGNASTLLDALNQMVRTAAGIGVFLVFTGMILLGASYYLILQIR